MRSNVYQLPIRTLPDCVRFCLYKHIRPLPYCPSIYLFSSLLQDHPLNIRKAFTWQTPFLYFNRNIYINFISATIPLHSSIILSVTLTGIVSLLIACSSFVLSASHYTAIEDHKQYLFLQQFFLFSIFMLPIVERYCQVERSTNLFCSVESEIMRTFDNLFFSYNALKSERSVFVFNRGEHNKANVRYSFLQSWRIQ